MTRMQSKLIYKMSKRVLRSNIDCKNIWCKDFFCDYSLCITYICLLHTILFTIKKKRSSRIL